MITVPARHTISVTTAFEENFQHVVTLIIVMGRLGLIPEKGLDF
jgi:hypothetical protein